ncbi:NAPDH-dependent diflavin reductase [Cladophialophora chaetospira]|uniref:NADPH-dependent diflavin oxidoreductase 1 n=1 Tax=Cladophialophora chaetospira TaxID=386627 RepID=A0AA38XFG2_9EURO|nr:NAPDH-dependent diflavin reductase [Cladophialophora chaetospira]
MSALDRDRSALVLYGTETGTSQDLAEEVGRTLERLHFNTDVVGLDAVKYHHLHEYSFTAFVIATTGQGDFPENARKFWTSLLKKKLAPTTLVGVDYALVGLGDTSYPKFNWAARKLDKRLRQLGAAEMLEPCEADEQGDEGTDGAFLGWLQLFRDAILKNFALPEGIEPIPNDVLLPSKWRLGKVSQGLDEQMSVPTTNGSHAPLPSRAEATSESFPVVLDINQRVTPTDHWQDVRFLSLRALGKIDYMPGDAIAISPRNMPTDVESLIKRMSWEGVADTPIRLVSTRSHANAASSHLSTSPVFNRPRLTLRDLLTEYLDINAIPRRSFFGCIANYTTDSMHGERLLEFTDPQYLDEYFDYATRPRRSILEILQEFDSVHLPWQEVTNIFPPMRPRQFSIASGGTLETTDEGATKIELLVAIVKYRTVIKRIREGVCTRYLAQLPIGTTLQVSLKTEGRFSRTPESAGKSHLLIGAGTGIAPHRALIHEKTAYGQASSKTALFFGCRNEKSDFFFQEEWTAIQAQNPGALEVTPAFSRDQKGKVYVQDRIRERSDLIWEYLRERQATIVVCGSSGAMPKAVRQALVDALVEQALRRIEQRKEPRTGSIGEEDETDEDDEEPIKNAEDAERYLARLEKDNRYKQETW